MEMMVSKISTYWSPANQEKTGCSHTLTSDESPLYLGSIQYNCLLINTSIQNIICVTYFLNLI